MPDNFFYFWPPFGTPCWAIQRTLIEHFCSIKNSLYLHFAEKLKLKININKAILSTFEYAYPVKKSRNEILLLQKLKPFCELAGFYIATKVERGVISENELPSVLDTLKCIMKGLMIIFSFLAVFDRKISNWKLQVRSTFVKTFSFTY